MRVRPIPAAVQNIENTGATQRSDFQPIFNRLLPKCVCLRGSAPDPLGGLTAPPKPPAAEGWVTPAPPLSHIPGSATAIEVFHTRDQNHVTAGGRLHFGGQALQQLQWQRYIDNVAACPPNGMLISGSMRRHETLLFHSRSTVS